MDFSRIISHMNAHHHSNLMDLCKKFGRVKKVQSVELIDVDFLGMDLVYNGDEKLRVQFSKEANEESLKDAIIALCEEAQENQESRTQIQQEIKDFMCSFNSVILATLNKKGETLCSYAPFWHTDFGDFIYISAIAEHFEAIKANPTNIEILFLQDESQADSVLLRKRLRYRANAEFIERGEFFDKAYNAFEAQVKADKGVQTIRNMHDFHLIKLHFKKGSFVKGFGAAYSIENGQIRHIGANTSPHKSPHQT